MSKKLTIEFVKTSFESEGYLLLDTVYINSQTKLEYICPNGHNHNIKWNDWQNGHRCSICYKNNNINQKHPAWKGGVRKRNLPLYDTYHPQISFCEETRRSPNEPILLQVKCTKCNEWYTPTTSKVKNRIEALNSLSSKESRFYCSDECKHECPIFYSHGHFSSPREYTFSEIQIWSKEVLKRADYVCEYCSRLATEAHHIQPKKLEPFYALDPDNGIACCKECHHKYGHTGSCSTGVLAAITC